jgi:hypothetical protein
LSLEIEEGQIYIAIDFFKILTAKALKAISTCDFEYESVHDSVYDLVSKVSGKLIFESVF